MRTRGCTALEAEKTRWLPQVACCAACCFICICCEGGKLPRQLWAGSCNAILLNCSRKWQWQWQATEGTVAIGECSAKCKSQCDRQLEAIAARFVCDLRAFCVRLLQLLLKKKERELFGAEKELYQYILYYILMVQCADIFRIHF